jgi:beta-lactam-binding protein with PASTA domain
VTIHVAAPSPDAVVVPSVLGSDEATANAVLTGAGLTVRVVSEAGASAPGTVWRQEPGDGVTVSRGREVTVWVTP